MVSLDRGNGSCNTLDNPSDRICVPNKTEDINLKVCNMITTINKGKAFTKLISYDCKCKFNGKKSN